MAETKGDVAYIHKIILECFFLCTLENFNLISSLTIFIYSEY